MSEQRIWIRGGRILDPAAERDEPGDVLIEDGVIAAIGTQLDARDAEVIEALTTLGYSVVEAQAALQSLPAEEMPLEEKLRLALAYFA